MPKGTWWKSVILAMSTAPASWFRGPDTAERQGGQPASDKNRTGTGGAASGAESVSSARGNIRRAGGAAAAPVGRPRRRPTTHLPAHRQAWRRRDPLRRARKVGDAHADGGALKRRTLSKLAGKGGRRRRAFAPRAAASAPASKRSRARVTKLATSSMRTAIRSMTAAWFSAATASRNADADWRTRVASTRSATGLGASMAPGNLLTIGLSTQHEDDV